MIRGCNVLKYKIFPLSDLEHLQRHVADRKYALCLLDTASKCWNSLNNKQKARVFSSEIHDICSFTLRPTPILVLWYNIVEPRSDIALQSFIISDDIEVRENLWQFENVCCWCGWLQYYLHKCESEPRAPFAEYFYHIHDPKPFQLYVSWPCLFQFNHSVWKPVYQHQRFT